jgi:hypothetical protein
VKLFGSIMIACAASDAVWAQQEVEAPGPRLDVGVGVERTNNAFRNDAFKRSETKGFVDANLGYLRRGERFDADILYVVEGAYYENETTTADAVIFGGGTVGWNIFPGRFRWDASHDRSEQLPDSRRPDTRNNRLVRNLFSTGPSFTARLGAVDSLVLSGRYIDVTYDDSNRPGGGGGANSDSSRLQGTASWDHDLSTTDRVSLSYQYMETDTDGFTEDFKYHRLYGTYAAQLRSSAYTISLGGNKSERDSSGSKNGFLAEIDWNLATGGHRFYATAINELTDSAIGLGGSALISDYFRPRDSNFDVIDLVERRSFSFGYGYDRLCERCTVDLGIFYDEQDFDVQPRDEKQKGVNGSFAYRFTPTLSGTVRASHSKSKYAQGGIIVVEGIPLFVDEDEKRYSYGVSVNWLLSRRMTAEFWLKNEERKSGGNRLGYEETYGGASLRYRFR